MHSVRQIGFEHKKALPPFFAEVGVCRLQTDAGLLIFSEFSLSKLSMLTVGEVFSLQQPDAFLLEPF